MTTAAPRIDLSGNRGALLQALLKKKSGRAATISRRADPGCAPLSIAQEQIWYLDQLNPGGIAYHIITPFCLTGSLDPAQLDRHLRTIRARHEILRTVFRETGGAVMQTVCDVVELGPVLEVIHLHDRGIDMETAQEILLRHAEQPFDLACGPLFRAALIQLHPRSFLGHITLHHIISDGWSAGVLFRELALLTTGMGPLPEIQVQYGDFAAWQRESLVSGRLDEQLSFWRTTLQDAPALLNLPLDHPRSGVQSTSGGLETILLPSHLLQRITALGEREGATLFMTLLAAYTALLSRYTGQNDIVVGTPIASRNRVEIEPLIGLFMNILAIRTRTNGDSSFRELIGRVRDAARAAYANQDAPFGKVVEMLRPERDAAYSPIVQAMFVLQNAPNRESQPGAFQIDPLPIARRSAKNDLTLYAEEVSGGLSLAFEYNASLFESATVRRMLCGLEQVLRAGVDSPDTRIAELPAMAEADRQLIIKDWNSTARPGYSSAAIHHLTTVQTLRTPDAIAVRFRGQALTYQKLERKSNQLARHLSERGARTGVLVAICMERSLDMLVAMLGVLKTGAAYVPLDPEYPSERIGWALDDSRALLLLTQSSIRHRIPSSAAEVIEIDRVPFDAWPGSAPDVSVEPADLAYVIFTSGSTGRPKGVQVTHGGVVNFLRSMAVEPGLANDDVLAALTTLSFDIAGLELLLPLTVGAQIELIGHEEARDGIRLAALLDASGATCVQATPATWRMLIEAGWQGRDWLKVLCGGEPMPADLAGALLSRCSELWNMYGPTETTIWSTVHRVRSGLQIPIPIGWPIANTDCYILDANLEPAPAGVAGDLYIGGDGVARGYLNQPVLTAEKFIPDPFRRAGSRLYRTGDLGRRRHDGTIECLGRTDHQVKIRGFRIELGEIEESLMLHSGVSRAAVIAADSPPGEKRLIAYLVVSDPVEDADLHTFLRARLPHYMLPSSFVRLTEMPLTPNGKVNRRALPAPDISAPGRGRSFSPPQTQTERKLALIFAEVLGLETVGRDENFFDLGGHSLLITKLLIRVRAEFGSELSVTDIFQTPTVAMIASKLDGITDPSAEIDFTREATLPMEIRPAWTAASENRDRTRVLLTGATGFLGMFLLRDLLERTSAEVICLARADDDAQARRRLERKLTESGLGKAVYSDRVKILAGDLAKPLLGLPEAMFEDLAGSLNAIYHCGAAVNFSQPYALLKAANVSGTVEILRLACRGWRKTVHYVSTISVLSHEASPGKCLDESAPLICLPRQAGGYPQSKWVAERLLESARERGVPVNIYRPGTITGDSLTGVCNPDDFLYRFLRGCIAMGSAPEIEMQVDLLPVDYVSAAIVALSRRKQDAATFHLAGTQLTHIRNVYAWMRSFGLEFAIEPYLVWRRKLIDTGASLNHPLAPLIGFFPELPEGEIMRVPLLPVESARTQAALIESGVTCRPPNEHLMHVYLKRTVQKI